MKKTKLKKFAIAAILISSTIGAYSFQSYIVFAAKNSRFDNRFFTSQVKSEYNVDSSELSLSEDENDSRDCCIKINRYISG